MFIYHILKHAEGKFALAIRFMSELPQSNPHPIPRDEFVYITDIVDVIQHKQSRSLGYTTVDGTTRELEGEAVEYMEFFKRADKSTIDRRLMEGLTKRLARERKLTLVDAKVGNTVKRMIKFMKENYTMDSQVHEVVKGMGITLTISKPSINRPNFWQITVSTDNKYKRKYEHLIPVNTILTKISNEYALRSTNIVTQTAGCVGSRFCVTLKESIQQPRTTLLDVVEMKVDDLTDQLTKLRHTINMLKGKLSSITSEIATQDREIEIAKVALEEAIAYRRKLDQISQDIKSKIDDAVKAQKVLKNVIAEQNKPELVVSGFEQLIASTHPSLIKQLANYKQALRRLEDGTK